jgi:tetratricopeptide (TPR) repeat protein
MIQSIQNVVQKIVSPTINQINERFHQAKNEINKISGNTQWFEHFKHFENILNAINKISAIRETAPQKNYQQDYQKAVEWFTKAAIQGFPRAQYRLGTLYTEGKVIKDDQKAIEWFKKAINSPKDEDSETKFITVLSQDELGKIYKKQAHYQEAKRWLEKVSKFDEVISEELYDKIDTKRLNDSRKSAQEMLIDIAKMEEKETAKQELEEVMGMFAHKFRGSLQSIEYLEKDETILEDVHTMDGLLNIFSLISTDASIIREKLLQDREGEGTLLSLLEQTLIMSLASVLALKNREKIRQHYINYAKKTEQVPISTTRKQWKTNHLDLELQLQKEWQRRFIDIKREPSLDKIITWLNERFFPIEIQGFAEAPIHFERYGATESILLVIMPEIFTNVLKYYASETQQAVQLHWNCGTQFCQFLCTNPTTHKEQRVIKGSGKGHQFLSLIARKLEGNFPAPPFVENYTVEFNIPNDLLMENNI